MCNLLVEKRRGDGVGRHERLERRRRVVGDAFTCPAFFERAGRAGNGAARRMGDDYFQTINDDYREAVVPDIYKAGYATLHPVDTGAAIPIYPSLTEGTSDRWARGEVQAHLDALRP